MIAAVALAACSSGAGAPAAPATPSVPGGPTASTPTEMLTDPSLLALPDGTWLMAISAGQNTLMTRSTDGLTFTRDATLTFGGVPEFARTVMSSPVNGHPIVCDPSLVAGAGLDVFKTGG